MTDVMPVEKARIEQTWARNGLVSIRLAEVILAEFLSLPGLRDASLLRIGSILYITSLRSLSRGLKEVHCCGSV